MSGHNPCPKCGRPKQRKNNQCADCRGYGRKRHLRPDGYIRVYVPGHPVANADGYAQEHRYVLYEAGITIPRGWHAHHLNGDKADNRLENLAVLKASAHALEHLRAAGFVTNQFGTWPLLTQEQRVQKNRDRCRENARQRTGYYDRHPEEAQA